MARIILAMTMALLLAALPATLAAAAAAAANPPPPCAGRPLLERVTSGQRGSLASAFVMAALASDAYPATLLQGATNAAYNTLRYEATLRRRWAPLGARSAEAVDDFEDALEAHAVVVGGAHDVFLAFRGTSTPDGWATNVRVAPAPLAAGGARALVHGGFARSFAAVRARVLEAVARATAATDDPSSARVYISGHSLGGAHAMLAALALSDAGAKIGGVWTFAAPKTGNAEFVAEFMRRFGGRTYRWVNGFDVVPTLPPELPGMGDLKQLPADATLWRTLGGACTKATGALLLDCPAVGDGGSGSGADDESSSNGGNNTGRKGGNKRRKEERNGGGESSGSVGSSSASGNGGGCTFAVADHRMFRALGALSRCAAEEAAVAGDACVAAGVRALFSGSNDDDASSRG